MTVILRNMKWIGIWLNGFCIAIYFSFEIIFLNEMNVDLFYYCLQFFFTAFKFIEWVNFCKKKKMRINFERWIEQINGQSIKWSIRNHCNVYSSKRLHPKLNILHVVFVYIIWIWLYHSIIAHQVNLTLLFLLLCQKHQHLIKHFVCSSLFFKY